MRDEHDALGGYWSPDAAMISSEQIAGLRAAIAATLELAVEALRELAEEKHGCMEVIGLLMAAGKLQQRANEVGNG